MSAIPFHTTNWDVIPITESKGETGLTRQRAVQFQNFKVRIVEYSENYKADHWCKRGHILYCLDGEMECELGDGRIFTLKKGMSYTVTDNDGCHRSSTRTGAKVMIIDGDFLKPVRHESNPWRM